MDLLTLCLRLKVVIKRKVETEAENYFHYFRFPKVMLWEFQTTKQYCRTILLMKSNQERLQVVKLQLMMRYHCGLVLCQRMKTSKQYLKGILRNLKSSMLILLFLTDMNDQLKMQPTNRDLVQCCRWLKSMTGILVNLLKLNLKLDLSILYHVN